MAEATSPLVAAPHTSEVGGRARYWFLLLFTALFSTVLFVLIHAPQPVLILLARGDLRPSQRYGQRIVRFWARAILAISGVRLEATGNVDPGGPAIFASNHQGTYDIFAMFATAPRFFTFVAKTELFRVPIIGWHLWLAGYVPVDRRDHARAVRSLASAGAMIRGGTSIVVYPEGTRSTDGTILPFKKGPFMLALAAGVPIIPVAIQGSERVMRKLELKIYPGTIRVAYGAPIDPKAYGEAGRDALMREVRRQVILLHSQIGGLGGDEQAAIAGAVAP